MSVILAADLEAVNNPGTGGGGGGGANLTVSRTTTAVTVLSDAGTDATIPAADANAGIMTAADRTKLNGIASGATANATDAQLRDRGTHTGTQAISTVTGLQTALDGKSSLRTVTTAYTADGAISPSDRIALINSASNRAMTLAAGSVDGQELIVKRYGAGTVTVTANIDGVAGAVVVADGGSAKEAITLVWYSALSTWLAV